jgi:predicted ATP-grasp superfamily ATP-dependent carboligase
MVRAYQQFDADSYHPLLLEKSPSSTQPMLQELHQEGDTSIYNLSGFIDRTGQRAVVRAGVKVLQHPRRLGIGLCFERAPLREQLVARLLQLCRNIGYFGVFEVEFLQVKGRELMIDFNPRFYHQMAFDLSRGLCLPELMYHGTRGAEPEFEHCLASARDENSKERTHSNRFVLGVMLRAQRLSGALSREEERHWRDWYRTHRTHCTDAVLDAADPLPGVVDVAHTVYGYARHPRGFLQGVVFNR